MIAVPTGYDTQIHDYIQISDANVVEENSISVGKTEEAKKICWTVVIILAITYFCAMMTGCYVVLTYMALYNDSAKIRYDASMVLYASVLMDLFILIVYGIIKFYNRGAIKKYFRCEYDTLFTIIESIVAAFIAIILGFSYYLLCTNASSDLTSTDLFLFVIFHFIIHFFCGAIYITIGLIALINKLRKEKSDDTI